MVSPVGRPYRPPGKNLEGNLILSVLPGLWTAGNRDELLKKGQPYQQPEAYGEVLVVMLQVTLCPAPPRYGGSQIKDAKS